MAVKKVLLQKMVGSALTDLYPKTDASVVVYNRNYNSTTTATTVEAELLALLTQFESYSTTVQMNAAIAQAKSEILGSDSLNDTLDTIKEIQDWIIANGAEATNMLSRLATLEGYVGNQNVTTTVESYITTNAAETGTKVPTAATVKAVTDALSTRTSTLEGYVGGQNVTTTVESYVVTSMDATGTKVPTAETIKNYFDATVSFVAAGETAPTATTAKDYVLYAVEIA